MLQNAEGVDISFANAQKQKHSRFTFMIALVLFFIVIPMFFSLVVVLVFIFPVFSFLGMSVCTRCR